jgi:multidrug resistance protein
MPHTYPGILSIQGYIALLASSVMAPSLPQIAAHYKISSLTVEALTLSIFVLAWAVGPLLFGPLTEVYGRRWPLIISNLVFLAFNIACIFAPNTAALIVFRFLAGLGASVPVAIGGALVGDLFVELERAAPQAVSYLGVLLGPPTGPIMGGYLAENVHFRYSFVLTSALSAVTLALALFFLRETYGPVAREHRAKLRVKALQHVLNSSDSEKAQVLSPQDQAELAHLQERAKLDVGSVLWISLLRPIQLLTQNFICFIFSLYAAL